MHSTVTKVLTPRLLDVNKIKNNKKIYRNYESNF